MTTPKISDQQATVVVEIEIAGEFKGAVQESVVLDRSGKEVPKASSKVVSRIGDDNISTRFGIRTIRWETKTGSGSMAKW